MRSVPSAEHAAGTAKRRRRERRLHQFLRHERLTVAMLLAETNHHAAPRGQTMARSGGWVRGALLNEVPEAPTSQKPGTQHFFLDDGSVPELGGRTHGSTSAPGRTCANSGGSSPKRRSSTASRPLFSRRDFVRGSEACGSVAVW